nr:MAG TPA: hypothetical protein [Bacteriophage sp.]
MRCKTNTYNLECMRYDLFIKKYPIFKDILTTIRKINFNIKIYSENIVNKLYI